MATFDDLQVGYGGRRDTFGPLDRRCFCRRIDVERGRSDGKELLCKSGMNVERSGVSVAYKTQSDRCCLL